MKSDMILRRKVLNSPLPIAAFALTLVVGYLACGIALAQVMGAIEFSLSWWALAIAWPVVISVYFAIAFTCIFFALSLARAAIRHRASW